MIEYYEQRVKEAVRIADDEAARGDFRAAIYKLTDALKEAMDCISELHQRTSK